MTGKPELTEAGKQFELVVTAESSNAKQAFHATAVTKPHDAANDLLVPKGKSGPSHTI